MMQRFARPLALLVLLALPLAACESTDGGGNDVPVVRVQMERAFPNLNFRRPVDVQVAPDGSNTIYVVEQGGTILAFENRQDVQQARLFLTITNRVSRQDNEEGLLGLAFHPDYAQNGQIFVYYSAPNPRRSIVARYTASGGVVDPQTEEILLEVPQPYGNHNAGQLQFGPDGYLYIALGDGGLGGDPQENGQNLRTYLGTLLRIDVDGSTNGKPYAIPPDNPYAGNDQGYLEEIYASGLRNPWRFSFDHDTGWLWLADVGQERFEEINIIERGGNYGWDIEEANWCFEPAQDCDDDGLEDPIFQYAHNEGRSITGGYVYHGDAVPGLKGRYIYGDYISGKLWALHYDGSRVTNHLLSNQGIDVSTFGIDQNGEVYVFSLSGQAWRFVAAEG